MDAGELLDRRSYSGVKLLGDEDVIEAMGYTLTNPVKSRLVNRGCQWLGATSAGMVFGWARPIRRPLKFFSEDMPEVVELAITRPGCFARPRDAEVLARVEADVARRESEHAKLGKAMGMKRVLEQDWRASPESFEARRQLQPTIKGRDKWARIEALQRSKEWLLRYKDALAVCCGGARRALAAGHVVDVRTTRVQGRGQVSDVESGRWRLELVLAPGSSRAASNDRQRPGVYAHRSRH